MPRIQDNIDIVDLSGKLVLGYAVTETRKTLLDLINTGQSRIILNLSEVHFIDSSGLSLLISALRTAQSKKGEVVLVALTPTVRSLIELTQMQKLFKIFKDEAAAISYLKTL